MQISRRLKAVAALVTAGGTVADIGTDHAYIPIHLIQTGAAARAIAMDVNPGPLARARGHIEQYGLNASVETRLSDGLARLQPGEADSVVIAGMGGALMTRILDEGRDRLGGEPEQKGRFSENAAAHSDSPDKAAASEAEHSGRLRRCRELILQPQSEIWLVRAWLERNGWQIVREDMVCEDGKYYPMMRAERCGDETGLKMNEMELRYGPLLLRERHPVLRKFLLHEKELNQRILSSLQGQAGAAAAARAEEVRGELRLIEEALSQI